MNRTRAPSTAINFTHLLHDAMFGRVKPTTMVRFTPFISIVITLMSCGPSAQEQQQAQQREAQRVDSIKQVAKDEMSHMLKTAQIAADSLVAARMNYQQMQAALIDARADGAVAADHLRQVSGFVMGRSSSMREAQIHEATERSELTKARVAEIEGRMPAAKDEVDRLQARVQELDRVQ
jgi:hypothetical protein